jgi:methyl-accepting chemotaxis protein
MLRASNVRISVKLAAVSGLGVLLVAGMLVASLYSNAQIKTANEAALFQQSVVSDVGRLATAFLDARLMVRNIRLATTAEEFDAANALAKQQKDFAEIFASLAPKLKLPANRERAEKVKADVNEYIDIAQTEVVPLKVESMSLDNPAILATEMQRLQHERLDPVAEKGIALLKEMGDQAAQLAAQETDAAAQQMAWAEKLALVIGATVIAVLIGSALFGVLGIARPLTRIAAVLGDLTNDRIVDVPYAARGDEIGQIAKATEVFKDSIAEKVVNFRVRSALDVVTSNVMLADDDYNIIYTNKTLQKTLADGEEEIRKVVPGFDSGKIIGEKMDVFHRNAEATRKLLDSLTGPHETRIALGKLKLALATVPVVDKHGKRVGTVVEWKNETAEKAIEEEVSTLVGAAVAGDFTRRLASDGKQGFMLALTNSMNSLCETIDKVLNDMMGMFGALADGDFRRRITADYAGSFGALKNDANAMADRVGRIIADIKRSTREVTNAAAEISSSTTDLSQRTEEQAASLEETSASMEEISATVKKNAENALQANQSASGTREVADRGGQVVARAVEAMARIEQSSGKISDIITVIDEIARQTNLLALNAAVEAARAGEAGRGFAVVASEVRTLAQRSSQAAKDIKELITNSNSQVKDGVDLVNKAGTALSEIVQSINRVADIVSDIANASAEQANGIEQVNRALTQMDEVTQQNSALVEENAATAKTLEYQANAMKEQVAAFQIDDAEPASSAADEDHAAAGANVLAAATRSHPAAMPKPERVLAQKRVANGSGRVRES